MASPLELFAHATQFFGQKVVLLGRFNGQVSLPSCFPAVLPSYFPTFLPFLLLRPLFLVQDGHLHLQTPRNPPLRREHVTICVTCGLLRQGSMRACFVAQRCCAFAVRQHSSRGYWRRAERE